MPNQRGSALSKLVATLKSQLEESRAHTDITVAQSASELDAVHKSIVQHASGIDNVQNSIIL